MCFQAVSLDEEQQQSELNIPTKYCVETKANSDSVQYDFLVRSCLAFGSV